MNRNWNWIESRPGQVRPSLSPILLGKWIHSSRRKTIGLRWAEIGLDRQIEETLAILNLNLVSKVNLNEYTSVLIKIDMS